MQVNLKDRVALVTGAARGIGLAIADAFAANGARVVYADIDEAAAKLAASRSKGSLVIRPEVVRGKNLFVRVAWVVVPDNLTGIERNSFSYSGRKN